MLVKVYEMSRDAMILLALKISQPSSRKETKIDAKKIQRDTSGGIAGSAYICPTDSSDTRAHLDKIFDTCQASPFSGYSL